MKICIGKYIRPKKQARVRSEKLKKVRRIVFASWRLCSDTFHCRLQNLQKAIGQKIEQELVAAASSRDGSSFHLLHSATTSGGKKDAKGTS